MNVYEMTMHLQAQTAFLNYNSITYALDMLTLSVLAIVVTIAGKTPVVVSLC
jgi:hypothetical protein